MIEYLGHWFGRIQILYNKIKRIVVIVVLLAATFAISFLAVPDILIDLSARQENRAPAITYAITGSDCIINETYFSACLISYKGPRNTQGEFYYSIFDKLDETTLTIEKISGTKMLTTNLGISHVDDRIITFAITLALLIFLTFWTIYYHDIVAFITGPKSMKPASYFFKKTGWFLGMLLTFGLIIATTLLISPSLWSDYKAKNEDRLPVPGYNQTEALCKVRFLFTSYCKFVYTNNQITRAEDREIKKEYFFLGYYSSKNVNLIRSARSGVITTNIAVNNVWNRITVFIGLQLFLLLGLYGCYISFMGRDKEEEQQSHHYTY